MFGLGQSLALDALKQAVLVADLDAWRAHLAGRFGARLATLRVRRALMAAARRLGMSASVDESTRLDLASELDPVGAKVALLQAAWLIAAGRASLVAEPSLGSILRTEAGASTTLIRRAELTSAFWRVLQERSTRQSSSTHARRRALLLLAAAALVILGVVFFATRGGAPGDAPPPLPTTPLAHLPPDAEAAWIGAVTDWVIAVDRHARLRAEGALPGPLAEAKEAIDAHAAAIVDPTLAPGLSAASRAAFTEVLSRGLTAADGRRDWEARESAFAEAVRALNRSLAVDGLGYFFDAYAALYPQGRGEIALFSFRVDDRIRYRQSGGAGAALVDALHLRRVDKLNLVQFLLGYTSKRMDVAVVLLDKLEQQLVTRLIPALAPNAAMPLRLDGADPSSDWWLAVTRRAGQLTREAFYAAFPEERQALTELGELLARRVALYATWNARLERRGITLRDPEGLPLAESLRTQLDSFITPAERTALDDIQGRLEVASMRRFFARLLLRHAAPVERHEVQHRIDYADPDFAIPRALLEVLGLDPEDPRVKSDTSIERAAYELSAYTAELARDPAWLHVNLALLAEHLYDGSGGAEGYTALLVLDGLARELGLHDGDPSRLRPLAERLPVAPERVAAVHLALMEQPGRALASAAERLWQRWFSKPLASLTREDAAPTPEASPAAPTPDAPSAPAEPEKVGPP